MTVSVPPNPAHRVMIQVRVDGVEHNDAAVTANEIQEALGVLGYQDTEVLAAEEETP